MKFKLTQIVRFKKDVWQAKKDKYHKRIEWLPPNRFEVKSYSPGFDSYEVKSTREHTCFSAHEDELEAVVE